MSSSINKDFAMNHVKEEFPTLHVAPEGVSSNSIVDDSKYKAENDDEEEGNYDQQLEDGQANEPKIKEEPTFEELQMRQIKNQRKYGDRVLLARQSKNGMLKLGGGNVKSYMWPRDLEEQSSRMNGRYCIAYNDLINHSAPKWAGELSACVSWFPLEKRKGVHFDPTSTPISVFVKRTVKESALGWEYCGEYLFLNSPECYDAAHNVSQKSKEHILKDMAASLKTPNGHYHHTVEYWRSKVFDACDIDSSPPGPTPLIRLAYELGFFPGENPNPDPNDKGKERQDREDREKREKSSLAAKARALGLDNEQLSEIEFTKRLVYLDEYYELSFIKFVKYDEKMYEFVKDGETTKNCHNKPRKSGEECAKALDWYKIYDQTLNENNKLTKEKRKRHRDGSKKG